MKIAERELNRHAVFGIAALLPGMQYMMERMQQQLDDFRAELGRLQHGLPTEPAAEAPPKRRGRPPGPGKGFSWANMTAEERSVEMRRRLQVGARKKAEAAKLSPRDKAHPDHDKWVAKMKRVHRKAWDSKSEEEKQAWKDKINAGRAKAERIVRRLNKKPKALAAA